MEEYLSVQHSRSYGQLLSLVMRKFIGSQLILFANYRLLFLNHNIWPPTLVVPIPISQQVGYPMWFEATFVTKAMTRPSIFPVLLRTQSILCIVVIHFLSKQNYDIK